MIVGSIYLGKKAQKAYRKRQAEKAAQKLTAPYDIADPSDEIQPGVPPSSPTDSNVSTTPLSAVPSDPLSKLGSRSSTSELSHSTSTRSQDKSVEAQEYNHYVQRHSGAEEPPSYDIVVSDGPRPTSYSQLPVTSRLQSEASPTSRPQSQWTPHSSAISPPSAYPSSTFSDRFQRSCNTCITMMETFQTIYPHPHNISPVQSRSPQPGQSSLLPPPNAVELPDQSVYQQRPVPQGTGPILEAPDTGTYQRQYETQPAIMPSGDSAPIELPADMPAQDLSELMRQDTTASRTTDQELEAVSESGILKNRGETA